MSTYKVSPACHLVVRRTVSVPQHLLSHSRCPRSRARIAVWQGKGKKANILDLNKYLDKEIRVKFSGGRERQPHRKQCIHAQHGHQPRYSNLCPRADRLLVVCVACVVTGVLKGYDPLMNLVLDETKEWLRDPFDPYKLTGTTHNHTHHTHYSIHNHTLPTAH